MTSKRKNTEKSVSQIDSNYREHVISNSLKSQQTYDKVLLTLTSGALVISVSFVHDLIDVHSSNLRICLYLSWVVWFVGLFLLLLSHLKSTKAWEKTLEQIDDGTLYKDLSKIGEPYTSCVERCNNWGFIFFLLGVVSFFLYLFINLEW